MNWRWLLVTLLAANVATAIAVVQARHEHRQLFVQLSKLEREVHGFIRNTLNAKTCDAVRVL